jgi:hypothetical protein
MTTPGFHRSSRPTAVRGFRTHSKDGCAKRSPPWGREAMEGPPPDLFQSK